MFALSTLIALTAALAAEPALAVLDLHNSSGDASLDPLERGVADLLVGRFQQADGVRVVERAALEKVVGELKLGQSGWVEPSSAARTGQLVGARWLVTGTLVSPGMPELVLAVRVIDAESAVVVHSSEAAGRVRSASELMGLVDQVAASTLGGLDLAVSADTRARWSADEVRAISAVERLGLRWEAPNLGHPEAMYRDSARDQMRDGHRNFWTVQNNQGQTVPMPNFSRKIGDDEGLAEWNTALYDNFRRRRVTRWSAVGLMVGGVAIAATAGASGFTERHPGAVGGLVISAEMGGLTTFLVGEIRHLTRRNTQSLPSQFYTPEEADAWIARYNAQLP